MVYKHFFGRTPEGQAVTRFTLFNHNTMEVNLLNYGAAVHSICVPDRAGRVEDITLGCDTVADYMAAPHFGGTIGRVANRIAGASFELNGKTYPLCANDGRNHGALTGSCGNGAPRTSIMWWFFPAPRRRGRRATQAGCTWRCATA